MDIKKIIEEATIKQILTTVIGALAMLCGAVGLTLWSFLPKELSNKSEVILIAELTLLLILSLSVCIAWIILLYQKLKEKPDFSKYVHSPNDGCWINPDNPDDRICSECKYNEKLTPMEKLNNYWQCPIHQRAVGNPGSRNTPHRYIQFDE